MKILWKVLASTPFGLKGSHVVTLPPTHKQSELVDVLILTRVLFQTTCISELPDVAPSGPGAGLGRGFFRGQNGSIRCNGRALGSRISRQPIHQDSSSCSSKPDSLDNSKGGQKRLLFFVDSGVEKQ